MPWGINCRGLGGDGGRGLRLPGERGAAFTTKLGARQRLGATMRASGPQEVAALDAEPGALRIVRVAAWAVHRCPLPWKGTSTMADRRGEGPATRSCVA